ncbi:uncharacterized protein LOC132616630 [Lycium barbarum]|uniref:uncharacterized protein LOC132616630 n=1 Tax=Lycium barbarum TaxID=112863 RepID=UPI00293F1F09|nr:uncharacterized protein LOC132616630 [Lycium barbarum]
MVTESFDNLTLFKKNVTNLATKLMQSMWMDCSYHKHLNFLTFDHHVNLSKLEFVALDISGKNYLSWVFDAEIHLEPKDKAKVTIFLRHHLDEGLKVEYLTVKDPLELWTGLKERITSQLKLCGDNITDEDMLEKTLTTFHASNLVLQQQYRERGFKKHADLISCLLVAE